MSSVATAVDADGAHPARMLDDLPISTVQKVVFVICFTLNMIDGMDVVIMSYSASAVIAEMGISYEQMGAAFSAALVGMALGGVLLGSYADYLGRRALILGGLVLVAAGVAASAMSQDLLQLIAARAVAGLGIGGLLASVTAMGAEYSPARTRNNVVMTIAAGYPLGAFLTGLVSAWAVPEFGWRATMMGAAALTAVMIPICFVLLPESLSVLARRREGDVGPLNAVLDRMGHPRIQAVSAAFFSEKNQARVSDLFNPTYRWVSLGLWGGLICTFMTLYFLLSWIPQIAIDSGLPPENAIVAGAMFAGGGVFGVWSIGVLADRFGYIRSMVAFCLVSCAMMLIYASYRGELAIILALALLMGFTVQGAVGAFYGASAKSYPVHMKSTGIGWTIGVGRIGAIVGPYLGGVLLEMELPLIYNFAVYGGIMVLAALLIAPIRKQVDAAAW